MGRRQKKQATSRVKIAQRRDTVSKLYLQGKTQLEISTQVGVGVNTIGKDLKRLREAWLASSLKNFDDMKSQELAKIDQLEATCWEGWLNSTTPQKSTYTKTELLRRPATPTRGTKGGKSRGGGKSGAHTLVPIKVVENMSERTSAGDPRFLEQIAKCIELRLKVIGAFKDSTSGTTVVVNWGDLVGRVPDDPLEDDPVEKMIREVEVVESKQKMALPDKSRIDLPPDNNGDDPELETDWNPTLPEEGIVRKEDVE